MKAKFLFEGFRCVIWIYSWCCAREYKISQTKLSLQIIFVYDKIGKISFLIHIKGQISFKIGYLVWGVLNIWIEILKWL